MDDAVEEPGNNRIRFFCNRCNVHFEDVSQRETCPFCATGFIEQIDSDDTYLESLEESEDSDAEMSNVDEAGGVDYIALDETLAGANANFNELAFHVFGMDGMARTRMQQGGERGDMLMEQLVWLTEPGRRRNGPVPPRAGPFQFVRETEDYMFAGEDIDAMVTQFLGQLEDTGPPPLPTEQISTIPSDLITAAQVEDNISCSVCWDAFTLDESVSRLVCAHIFHEACINPWLQLHATCPICRRSLLPPVPTSPLHFSPATLSTPPPTFTLESQPAYTNTPTSPSLSYERQRWRARAANAGSSSGVPNMDELWAQNIFNNSLANADSPSLNSRDTNRFMNFDY